MAKKKKEEPKVNIDGTEYKVSDLSKEQIDMVNHVEARTSQLVIQICNVIDHINLFWR